MIQPWVLTIIYIVKFNTVYVIDEVLHGNFMGDSVESSGFGQYLSTR